MSRRTAPRGRRWRDRLREAAAELAGRPVRALLTSLGTAAGVATLVATVGVASTVRAQVSSEFDRFSATEVVVEGPTTGADGPVPAPAAFPDDHARRVRRLPGVVDVGRSWEVDTRGSALASTWRPSGPDAGIAVLAADPGALDVIEPSMVAGRRYDRLAEGRALPVALLSAAAAHALDITSTQGAPQVFVGDHALTVVGIFDDVHRESSALLAAIVPAATAEDLLGGRTIGPARLLVEVRPGAAAVVARQAPVALAPHDPERVTARAPLDPRSLRRQVQRDLTALFYGLGGLSLLIGAASITSTTLVSVMERVPEIGVRRALGARRVDVVAQLLTESAAIGVVGGVVGTSAGILVVAAVSLLNGWVATLDVVTVLAAPWLGAATGLLAGVHPAVRAARIEPTDALRHS